MVNVNVAFIVLVLAAVVAILSSRSKLTVTRCSCDSNIVIYLVVNDDYFELSVVMLHSLKRHLRRNHRLVVMHSDHLPNAHLSETNRASLRAHLGVRHFWNVDAQWMNKVKLANRKAYPALLALAVFENKTDDIIVFLDADMLVLSDFSDIFDELDDTHVHGSSSSWWQSYINTGMFCVTRKFLDEADRVQTLHDYVAHIRRDFKQHEGDQDIINACFPVKNHDWRTNYRPRTNDGMKNFRIVHWAGMTKPNGVRGACTTTEKPA